MKRMSYVLATLTAIILLSCGFLDNSSSSTEDADFSQATTLNKATLSSSSTIYTTSQSLGLTIGAGETACSNELVFAGPSTILTSTVLSKVEFYTGNSCNMIGAMPINSLKIRKDSTYYTEIPWNGGCNMTLTTHAFDGLPAKGTYYVSFCGTCLAGGIVSGLPVNFCSRTYSGVKLILYITY